MLARLLRILLTRTPGRPTRGRRTLALGLEPLEAREVPATVYGLGAVNTLLEFDSAAPGAPASSVQVTGLGPLEVLIGVDFSPSYDALYGFTVPVPPPTSGPPAVVKLYKIDPLTQVATPVSPQSTLPNTGDVATGVSFDPSNAFSIRLVNANDVNAHFTAGAFTADSNLTPTGSQVVAAAYDRSFPRTTGASVPTTLYGISRATSSLVTIGGIDGGASGGPNGGAVATVGALGVTLDAGSDAGFDILKSTDNGGRGTALASLTVGGVTGLYSINLSTGAATRIGTIGNGTTRLRSLALVPDSSVVVGSGPGANGDVRVLDPDAATIRRAFVPFAGFQGGVKVAAGDVNGDGVPDAIVSADASQGHIKVFDGKTGAELYSFFAFPNFDGTVNVASGDVNGDGFADVIVAANGASGHVKAFSGKDGSLLASFLAYPGFAGNVTAAAADFDNDGRAEIVTVASANGHVKAFRADGSLLVLTVPGHPVRDPLGVQVVYSFLAFDGFTGPVNVAAGELNTPTGVVPTIVVSSGAGTRGHVKVFDGRNLSLLASFFALPPGTTSGAFVALADANSDGVPDIRVTPGFGVQANVLAFDLTGLQIAPVFPAFANFLGGATVAGARF
jgi:hypothetical protein